MNIAQILAENLIFLAHSMPPETGAAQLNLLTVVVHRKTKIQTLCSFELLLHKYKTLYFVLITIFVLVPNRKYKLL